MKFVFASVGAALLLAANAVALTINTPTNAVVCQPLLITWADGTPPYFLSVVPANQPGAAALVDLGSQTGTSFTWLVNIAAGTQIGLNLRDSTGALAQSAPFGILAGSSTTCVGQNPSSASSAASGTATTGATTTAAATTTAPAATTTPAVTTARPATTAAPGTTTGKATTAGSSASPSASKAAGSHIYGQVGSVGAFAVAVVAALA